jgi:hypothetical protein
MAKLSSINKNNKRIKLADKFYKKREKLKKNCYGQETSFRGKIQGTAKIV